MVYSSLTAQRSATSVYMHTRKVDVNKTNLTVDMSIMLQMSVLQNKFNLPRMSYC